MKKFTIVLILFAAFIPLNLTGQSVITGFVSDAESNERLIGVALSLQSRSSGAVTNSYGYYSLPVPSGEHVMEVSHIGYEKLVIPISGDSSASLDIKLVPTTTELKEVQISGMSVRPGLISLEPREIQSIPAILGEQDLMKALQKFPGVQGGAEGFSGLHVRGGSPDQNLILLDGVQVYNAFHLFGFFSVFNPDVVKDVQLYKGNFPARYSGRLSSVLKVDLIEGNMNKFRARGSVGLISSKLTVEGPIVKDKISFVIAGRRSYYDLLTKLLAPEGAGLSFAFGDVNAKINYNISRKDRVYISFYGGKDSFENGENSGDVGSGQSLEWGNTTVVGRWNHLYSNKLFSNLSVLYSRYDLRTRQEMLLGSPLAPVTSRIEQNSEVADLGFRYDFEHQINAYHMLNYGITNTYHQINPALTKRDVAGFDNTSISANFNSLITSNEFSVYIEDRWDISSRASLHTGLNYTGFVVESSYYDLLQPRASLNYDLTSNLSLTASYSLLNQNIHLLTNVGMGLPSDLWVSSTDRIRPQRGSQWALGGSFRPENLDMEFTIGTYFKRMKNLIDYKEGATFNYLEDWEDLIATGGTGTSYGFELLARKTVGKLNGWVGYNLAWSNRQFEEINRGNPYPYKYDRRHKMDLVGVYQLNKKVSFGATWTFMTGHAFTSPSSVYEVTGIASTGPSTNVLVHYTDRNAVRFPNYHRLDLNLNFRKEKPWGERTWSIGLYNAYNRLNPFYIYVEENERDNSVEVKQVTLFPIIPSVVYSFKF